MSLSNSQWAILLEAISFFLVTLDLWGKKNLELAHERINGLSSRFKRWAVTPIFSKSKLMINVFSIIGLIIGVMIFITLNYFSTIPLICNPEHNPGFSLAGVFVFVASVMLPFYFAGTTHDVVTAIISIIEWILDLIISIFLCIFRTVKFEGILLFAGTIIFLVSKYISFQNG